MVVARDRTARAQYAPPFKVSGHAFRVTRDAPAQGEHSAEVLREAGYDDAAIADSRDGAAIAAHADG